MSLTDQAHMAHALRLGRRAQGQTWPNPAVGCVIVADSRVVGRGWTQPGGRPHAETQALSQAGTLARGATAYVTLEPCAHHGKTPPCAEALVRAGVARVVAAVKDSDARVSGQGFAILERAGIKVESGVLADEAMKDHAGFFRRIEMGRPFVTLKLAASLDGRIATATGESQWITGTAARRDVHAARARHDAVMVGAGTARADDPSLTVRGLGISHQPVRVVVSRHLSLPLMGNLARTAKDVPVWLCHGRDVAMDRAQAWRNLGATLLPCDVIESQIDPFSVLHQLAEQGLTRVYCEGGGSLAASLLSADAVDEITMYSAGLAIGAEGQPSLGAMGTTQLPEAARYDLIEVRAIGADVLHRWARKTA